MHDFVRSLWIPSETTPCYTDPDAWTDSEVHKTDATARNLAKKICQTQCHFREECLEAALELEGSLHFAHRYGIWGGTTPKERYLLAPEKDPNGFPEDSETVGGGSLQL